MNEGPRPGGCIAEEIVRFGPTTRRCLKASPGFFKPFGEQSPPSTLWRGCSAVSPLFETSSPEGPSVTHDFIIDPEGR
jgi:hypothetical protein